MNGSVSGRFESSQALPDMGAPQLVPGLRSVDPYRPVSKPRRAVGWSYAVRGAYAAIDVVCVVLSCGLAFFLRFSTLRSPHEQIQLLMKPFAHAYFGYFFLYAALVVLCCMNEDLYRTPRSRSTWQESWSVVRAIGISTALLALSIVGSANKDISRMVLGCSAILNIFALSGWRAAKRNWVMRRTAAGIGLTRVLIVGTGRVARALARWLQENRQLGYEFCGFLGPQTTSDIHALGGIKDLRSVTLAHFVDELFITLSADRRLVKQLVAEARSLKLNLKVVPELYDGLGWHAPIHTLGGFPLLELYQQPIPAIGLGIKRGFDVLIAAIGLILLAPLLGILLALIRLDSPGPALYVADRIGKKGRKFRCYKLRTMVTNADARKDELRVLNERTGPCFKIDHDPRLTAIGRWLRRFSLDELPQLLNVLRGDMSLIGPRPHPLDDFERYDLEHLRRLDVKPGITGLWQVTARKDPSFETNMALDLQYIENWSLLLDMQILARTVPVVLRAEGR